MLNEICIMGRLTRDPELRSAGSQNIPVASFSVAVDRDFGKDPDGNKQTDFFEVVAWRQTGEFVSKYFQKGSLIVVTGAMQSRRWTDKDGNKRLSWEIIADRVYFGGSKRDGETTPAQMAAPAAAPQQQGFTEIPDDEDDGELPF